MKSTIRKWNPDAGTYGDVLLVLYAPDTGDFDADDRALWDATVTVAPLMGEPCAIFWDDEPKSSNHYSNWQSRRAA